MMESLIVHVCIGLVVICSCSLIVRVCELVWLTPRRIRSTLRRQGISGPPGIFPYGNLSEMDIIEKEVLMTKSVVSDGQHIYHNWCDYVFPCLHRWSLQYGQVYMYSTGNKQHLYIARPDLMKELHLNQSLDFGRSLEVTSSFEPLLGQGIIRANGQHWVYQKKLLAPEFFLDKVKDMMIMMVDSTITMTERWEAQIKANAGILNTKVDEDLRSVSADIISRACFGTSYSQGKFIFTKMAHLQDSLSKPGALFRLFKYRCLPTKNNREVWNLKKEIDALVLKVVKDRQTGKSEKDLLQKLVHEFSADNANIGISRKNRLMIDICKNIYFAGFETGALTVSWCLMLLGLCPEWQERVRHEILQVFGPDHDYCRSLRSSTISSVLPNLKLLTMVIQETLRLYGPSAIMAKEAFADITFGDIMVPKGTTVWNLIPSLHRDPANWGPDADDFNPQRFSGGVSEACKYPHAYMPFGYGSRQCLGQAFAMAELKIVLSLILSKFSFSISSDYRHSPVFRMLLVPEHGVRLLITSL